MDLITTEQRAKMLENGQRSAQGETIDPPPVVKLFWDCPGLVVLPHFAWIRQR
ncbi:DUF2958 domain-containing protein [Methylobacterium nodulans]|uniref:DUF2958 domain-containing protein n=1 Tax=Methylobacterium nodulans TaxID=114616 RepID=UPI0009FE15BF